MDTPALPAATPSAAITATSLVGPADRASPLSLRRVGIDTYRENVAYLNRNCAVYRAEGFQALSKIQVQANGRHVLATLNVVDDDSIVACGEVGLSEDAFRHLGIPDGHTASVSQAEPPASMEALFRKINGERLDKDDFHAIVQDIARSHSVPRLGASTDAHPPNSAKRKTSFKGSKILFLVSVKKKLTAPFDLLSISDQSSFFSIKLLICKISAFFSFNRIAL